MSTPSSLWTCRRQVGTSDQVRLGLLPGVALPLAQAIPGAHVSRPMDSAFQTCPSAFSLPRPHPALLPAALGAAHQPVFIDTPRGQPHLPFSVPCSPVTPDLPRQQGSDIFGFILSPQHEHLGVELPILDMWLCSMQPTCAGHIDA